MEEVQTSNKLPWIIAGIVVAVIILAGIAISVFSSSFNSFTKATEKAPEDMTAQELVESCMQTCSKIPLGLNRNACESGCAKIQEQMDETQKALAAQGITKDDTIGEMQEKLSVDQDKIDAIEKTNLAMYECISACENVTDKAACMNSCA